MQSKFNGLKSTALFSAFFVLCSPAFAQQDSSVETVVVTGSRIARPETDVANPVVSLSAEDIQHSGTVNLTDYLKRIPALTGSLGDFDNSGYNSHVANDGSSLDGLNLLDLRNLGYVRTLVLQDGHRLVSESTGSTAVDIESIPITLIDRVEVVTGGSSAVYGADGVSGVVNFVMKHDLDGVTARVQYGDSQDGGGAKWLAAASVGRNFDDGNGNVTFTLEESHQDNLEFDQRSFTSVGGYYALITNPANRSGRNPDLPANIFTNDGQFTYSAPTGAITTDFSSKNPDLLPNYLGNGQPYIRGTQFIDGGVAIGSSGMPFADDLQGDFQPYQNRQIAQVEGDEQFNKWFKLSAEFKYAHVGTQDLSTAPYDDTIMISAQNAFLPSNVSKAIAGDGLGYGILSEDYLDMRNGENVDRDTYRSVIEATGALPAPDFIQNFKYDASYVYGQTDIADTIMENRNIDRFAAALDSVIDPATGNPTCRSNLDPGAVPPTLKLIYGPGAENNTFSDQSTWGPKQFGTTFTPGPNSGCVPFNPFDPNYNNKASIAWMTSNTETQGFISQQVLSGFISGEIPFVEKLGFAKPTSIVVGGEYREEVSKSSPDPETEIPGLYWDGGTLPVSGRFHVSEAFGEANIPVLADLPAAHELSFDVAGRLSDYSTAGSSQSWKIDGLYSPFSGIKFRGTDALAVRAPNIGELFAPVQEEYTAISDPCDLHNVNAGTQYRAANCTLIEHALGFTKYVAGKTPTETDSTTPEFVGGNEALTPETARTQTLGIVLQPDFLPDFVATADWYRVNISNAIEAPAGQDVANECVDLSTINNPFCAEITRTATGRFPGSIKQVEAREINVAAYFTKGIDFSISYHQDIDNWFDAHLGSLDFHLIGNHLDSLTETPLPGEKPVQWANVVYGGLDGTPAPDWQMNLDTVWTYGNWTVDYNVDWYDGMLITDRQTYYSQPNYVASHFWHIAPRDVHSLQVGYDLREGWNVYIGIDNLWYQKPSIGQSGYPVDPLGRFFYGGVKVDLNP